MNGLAHARQIWDNDKKPFGHKRWANCMVHKLERLDGSVFWVLRSYRVLRDSMKEENGCASTVVSQEYTAILNLDLLAGPVLERKYF